MQRHYISTGTYQRREDGKELSVLAEHRIGVSKEGKPYNYLATDSPVYADVLFPVGAKVIAEISYALEDEQVQLRPTVKLGKD